MRRWGMHYDNEGPHKHSCKKTCVCVWILASFFEEQRHGDKETYINTERGNKIAKHGK